MQTLSVRVLGTPDYYSCTNNGITSRFRNNLLELVDGTDEEIREWASKQTESKLEKTLILEKRVLFGKQLWFCKPLLEPSGRPIRTMGGCFVTTSDSRFKNFTPHELGFPLPVHDRFDTQKDYDAMCV